MLTTTWGIFVGIDQVAGGMGAPEAFVIARQWQSPPRTSEKAPDYEVMLNNFLEPHNRCYSCGKSEVIRMLDCNKYRRDESSRWLASGD